jgi:hypothetical protein
MARNVPAGAGFAYQVAVRTLDEQLRRIEALDTKAGVVIAAGGLVIGLLAGERSSLVEAPTWVRVTVLGTVTFSLVLALLAFSARRYDTAPNPDAAVRLMTAEPEWLEWRFLGNLSDSIAANRSKLSTKSRLLSSALSTLIAGAAVLGGYLVVHTITAGA